MKNMIWGLTIILLLFVALLVTACNVQERLIFFPEKLPQDYTFPERENVVERNFTMDDNISLHALHFTKENPKGLILYFHGNAGSLASWEQVAEDFFPFDYDVLIVDYRGYGKSGGTINSEKQFHADAATIYTAMTQEFDESTIIIYGRSIGTGIACKLSAENNPKHLILETPFYNFKRVVKYHYRWLPVSLILKYHMRNNEYLQSTSCPVSIIHGTIDNIIPYEQGKQLSELSTNFTLFTIQHGGHNNLGDFNEFHEALKRIIQDR